MTAEVVAYQPRAVPAPVTETVPSIDSWTVVITEVAKLAQYIADTDFVPAAMRGKPAAVAAAILAGREMGVGPMTALANINVIKGKPGSNALLMRQLTLAAGHEIRYVETTDTRCVVEGRRHGEQEWSRVVFTADQARKAGIQLGGYPEDKLVARATTRLCRRKFSDAIGGMPYSTEELEDGDDLAGLEADVDTGAEPAPAEPAQRKAKRRTATRTQKPQPASEAEPEVRDQPAEQHDEPAGPALPGEDDPEPAEPPPLTKAQQTKLHAIFTEHHVEERDERLAIASTIVGRPLASSSDLRLPEAGALIDTLERLAATGDFPAALAALFAELEAQDHEPADGQPADEEGS